MNKFNVLNCICLRCRWTWEVLAVGADREQVCPECKSYDTKTFLKRFDT